MTAPASSGLGADDDELYDPLAVEEDVGEQPSGDKTREGDHISY